MISTKLYLNIISYRSKNESRTGSVHSNGPESNATSANFTRTINRPVISGCKSSCDADNRFYLLHSFLDEIKLHALCKNNSIRKTVNDGLSKILVRALTYGYVWVDDSSLFLVSGVANTHQKTLASDCLIDCEFFLNNTVQ